MNRIEGRDELTRPVVEDVHDRHALSDGEGEVEIGPAIAGGIGQRADDGAGNDARIGLSQVEHPVTDALAVVHAEHRPLCSTARSAHKPKLMLRHLGLSKPSPTNQSAQYDVWRGGGCVGWL